MKTASSKRRIKLRLGLIAAVYLAVMVFFLISIGGLQITQGSAVREEVSAEASVVTQTVTTEGRRGSIYDCRGVALVESTLTYGVELQYAAYDKVYGNETLRQTLTILRKYGYSYTDSLPVTGGSFPMYLDSDDEALAAFLAKREWDSDIDAQDLYEKLLERYDIPDSYTANEARMVAGVRYDMEILEFSALNPIVLASDVDREAVVALECQTLPGVEIVTQENRQYRTTLLAHVLGRVGYMYPEDTAYYTALGYPADAKVGLFGIEAACETLLRGTDGSVTRSYDEEGRLLSEQTDSEAASGADVYLTVDLRLQEAAENALATRIEAMRRSGDTGSDAGGGAAVVVRVGTGEVLASASYPTYDLSAFSEIYQSLLEDENTPMVNRATNGLYAPGSVFKMVTAAAALQDGIIDTTTEILDEGVYRYYAPDYLYHCWLYKENGTTHGSLNVAGALQNSCNYFFYEVGRLLGIDRIRYYAGLFGLGEKTGVEIAESTGMLAGSENHNGTWYPGDTLMAAIGQSDNLFTPLQLANYVAAICSGGKRYQAHFIQSVIASDGTLLENKTPVLLSDANLTEENLNAILDGMRRVTEDGTASRVFEDYPIDVIGKTGSAEVSDGEANGVFVLAAPAENPEIAIAVVVEHGGSGNNVAWIARDILDAYLAIQADN